MPKALLRRYLPDPDKILASPSLGFLGSRLRDPGIWHLNRRSASGAVFWGLFCAFLPMPMQMVPAAVGVVAFRVNLPLTMVLVWLTNPLTWLPCMYLAYTVGTWFTGTPGLGMEALGNVIDQISTSLPGVGSGQGLEAGTPLRAYLGTFVLGSLVTGLGLGLAGYVAMRSYWRWHVVRAWQQRCRQRQSLSR